MLESWSKAQKSQDYSLVPNSNFKKFKKSQKFPFALGAKGLVTWEKMA